MNVTDRANIAYWYPKLYDLPTPRTLIVTTDVDLWALLEGEQPDGWEGFTAALTAAAASVGTPCFLRTGWLSAKHDWSDTCHLDGLGELGTHVARLVEASVLAGMEGLPTHTWAVRKLIRTHHAFRAFTGRMPVTAERRWFVAGGQVVGHHPYWPPDAIWGADRDDWRDRLDALEETVGWADLAAMEGMAGRVARRFDGAWSVDFLRGAPASPSSWWLIDMAPAERSWCWFDHPDAPTPERIGQEPPSDVPPPDPSTLLVERPDRP